MSQPIRIELGKIEFCLKNLKGTISFLDLVSFEKQLIEKTEQLSTIADPRSFYPDLTILSRIHKSVEEVTNLLIEEEKYKCRYWLATLLFYTYFSRYELFQEGFGCRQAWAHLLKIRYHSMVALYRLREQKKNKLTAGEQRELLRAFRDWRDFCTNDKNHFLFRTEQRLGSPEEEVKGLIFVEEAGSKTLISSFRTNREERRLLDLLIADWFLRDRYDWFGAVRLLWHRAKVWSRLVLTIPVLLSIFCVILYWAGYVNLIQSSLLFVYPSLCIFALLGFSWRTVMDVLLPRLWAGTAVGYIPLLLTPELWKIPYDNHWWGSFWYGIFGLNFVVLFLTFFYLRWEVGNRLRRTPDLADRMPIRRAAWLTAWGWIVALSLGLAIFDILGAPIVRAIDWNNNLAPTGMPGLLGVVHLPALFLFAPFALLIGVIVQIFWEEKTITHPA